MVEFWAWLKHLTIYIIILALLCSISLRAQGNRRRQIPGAISKATELSTTVLHMKLKPPPVPETDEPNAQFK